MQYETTQSKREVAKWDFSETFDKIFALKKVFFFNNIMLRFRKLSTS